jgi:hypothetical protein
VYNVVGGEQGGDGSEDVTGEGVDVVDNMNRVDLGGATCITARTRNSSAKLQT